MKTKFEGFRFEEEFFDTAEYPSFEVAHAKWKIFAQEFRNTMAFLTYMLIDRLVEVLCANDDPDIAMEEKYDIRINAIALSSMSIFDSDRCKQIFFRHPKSRSLSLDELSDLTFELHRTDFRYPEYWIFKHASDTEHWYHEAEMLESGTIMLFLHLATLSALKGIDLYKWYQEQVTDSESAVYKWHATLESMKDLDKLIFEFRYAIDFSKEPDKWKSIASFNWINYISTNTDFYDKIKADAWLLEE